MSARRNELLSGAVAIVGKEDAAPWRETIVASDQKAPNRSAGIWDSQKPKHTTS